MNLCWLVYAYHPHTHASALSLKLHGCVVEKACSGNTRVPVQSTNASLKRHTRTTTGHQNMQPFLEQTVGGARPAIKE